MDWTIATSVAIALFGLFLLNRLTYVSLVRAREFLAKGAIVVDVRSSEEFLRGHLPCALNLPLPEVSAQAARQLPAKDRTLLLYCLSGTRSSLARRQLRQLGYSSVYNLGSIGRARKLIE